MMRNRSSPELWRTVRVGVEIGNLMMMMISTNSARWGGDRKYDDDDDDVGEQCEVGWRWGI